MKRVHFILGAVEFDFELEISDVGEVAPNLKCTLEITHHAVQFGD